MQNCLCEGVENVGLAYLLLKPITVFSD